jgi:hypothetical protein
LRERKREEDNKLRDEEVHFSFSEENASIVMNGRLRFEELKAPIYFEAVYMQLKIAVMTRHSWRQT